jgi:hypothetical protein
MEMLHSNGDLQISTVALIIDVRNMWEVSMEGFHSCACAGFRHYVTATNTERISLSIGARKQLDARPAKGYSNNGNQK